MPFETVRYDITKMTVDAIVNTADPKPVIGSGTDEMIHTVGPVWIDGQHNEEANLSRCYEKSLYLAKKHGCESIAFPHRADRCDSV